MKFVAAILMALGMMSGANATILQGRDITGKSVDEYDPSAVFLYDPIAKITWQRDLSTNRFGSWSEATAWASTLNISGITGWRLPLMQDTGNSGCDRGTDCGYNPQRGEITTPLASNPSQLNVYSELARLYYDILLNTAPSDINDTPQANFGLRNTGPFVGLIESNYWTGLQYPDVYDLPNYWVFDNRSGYQGPSASDAYFIAVRPGDVCSENCSIPVPAPATLALLGLGLAGIARRSTSPR